MSWIAEYDAQGREFPTGVHVTRTTGTMMQGATYVPIEDVIAVRAENVRLKELLRDAGYVLNEYVSQLEGENGELRELVRRLFEVNRIGAISDEWNEMQEVAKEMGVEVKDDA